MIDILGDISEDSAKEMDLLGEWPGVILKPQLQNPFTHTTTNPFFNTDTSLDQNNYQKSVDLLFFDPPTVSNSGSSGLNLSSLLTPAGLGLSVRRDNPFFRSKRSYSLSELSILQSDNPHMPSGFFGALKSPAPEQFQSREDFREAWLNHRKLARSCHDLDSIGQNLGWGQTQPVETNIVCRLDHSGGAVQLPDTNISIYIPEGHILPGDTQQISMKALLDPPLELNSDRCTTVSPVVEIKLSNMETKSTLTLEMKVSVVVKMESRQSTEVLCVRSDCKEGPYTPVPQAYMYGDTVQVSLDNLEPCMYVCVVAQSKALPFETTVWEHVVKKITLGVYGPKHIHPLFKTVVAIFGHDCAPKTLLVNEVRKQAQAAPSVALQLWGKHQFVLSKPQDLHMGVYSNMANYKVQPSEAKIVRGFQVKLGKISRLVYVISSQSAEELSDFTLRIQVKSDNDCILAQFCVQTPTAPPKAGPKSSVQRRFLKKKEVGKIVLSPLAVATKYPVFQDRTITNLKFGKLIKTVIRQTKNQYLLEYKKGDFVMLLSEEKIKLKGQLWTKEWHIGYYQGKVGLVHAKNVLIVGKVKPVYFNGPELTTSVLLEQLLKPSKFLTYIYASVRTILMENIGDWRAFADALGYKNLPLTHFCRAELDSEPERVASVLEKLKEDCNNADSKERKSFQKELLTAMWKPAYDFLVTWAAQIGDSYRDVLQELHLGLDRMKSPITKRWRHLSGTLILVYCLDQLRSHAFSPAPQGECAI
ncbi:hypothetical protein WMY93_002410 [Mugilogobius chulae]|uniref:ZU5 domain-containing protein n=1 Tax=Mugilogobius chulae TaxID=88201 RepID=A0AAW0PWH6_9GOBI